MSDQSSVSSGSFLERPSTGATGAFKTIAVLLGLSSVIAIYAPLLSSSQISLDGALADNNSDLVVYVFAVVAVLAVAAFVVKESAVAVGLIGGVGAASAGYFILVDASIHAVVDAFGTGVSYGAGFVFGAFAALIAVTAVIMAFKERTPDSGRAPAGGWATVGACAAAATTVGVMLPPNNSGIGFSERNFDFPAGWLQFGWLAFVVSVGLPGVVGFASRSRWGLAVACGTWVPTAWLTITAISDDSSSGSGFAFTSFDNVHPVWPIAVGTQMVALVLGYQALQRTGRSTVPPSANAALAWTKPQPAPPTQSLASTPTDSAGAAPPTGAWADDPYGRHQKRYHDGTNWTDHVADDGVTASGPGAHPAPDQTGSAGAWAPDPFGRHRQRFFDGRSWTRHVADSAGVGSTDEPSYPPPTPVAPGAAPGTPPSVGTSDVASELEVAYDMTGWSPAMLESISEQLHTRGIGHQLDGGELLVNKRDEADADDIIAACTGDKVDEAATDAVVEGLTNRPEAFEPLPPPPSTAPAASPSPPPGTPPPPARDVESPDGGTSTLVRTMLFDRTGGWLTPDGFDDDISFATGTATPEGGIRCAEPEVIRFVGMIAFVSPSADFDFKGVGEMLVTATRVAIYAEDVTVKGRRAGGGTAAASLVTLTSVSEVEIGLDRKGRGTRITLLVGDGVAGIVLAAPISQLADRRLRSVKDVTPLAQMIIDAAAGTGASVSWVREPEALTATIAR